MIDYPSEMDSNRPQIIVAPKLYVKVNYLSQAADMLSIWATGA